MDKQLLIEISKKIAELDAKTDFILEICDSHLSKIGALFLILDDLIDDNLCLISQCERDGELCRFEECEFEEDYKDCESMVERIDADFYTSISAMDSPLKEENLCGCNCQCEEKSCGTTLN